MNPARRSAADSGFVLDRLSLGGLGALLLVVTLLAYWPALHGALLWDDDGHVTRPDLLPLSGLLRIWFEPGATQQYYPVLHSAFWIEHHLWGDATTGYHLVNVLLHASAACLFAKLLRMLAVPGAALAALLFALHPVATESVAWISEQKNTLSTVLYLLGALAWLRFDATRRPPHYARATVCFALAVLTKTVTATLPAALLVIVWWRRGRIDLRRDALPLLPWFAFGLAAGLFTAHFERTLIGASGADFDVSLIGRILLAGRVAWFYFGKLLWPADLMFIYPRWRIDAADPAQWLFLLAALALAGALVWQARRTRGPLAIFLLFGGSLFPALGFFNVYPFIFSFVADHFQYLASLALFAAAGVLLARAMRTWPAWAGVVASVALAGTLGAVTWTQSQTYRDNETLFRTTLARNPNAWMAHNNLGNVLAESGRAAEAVPHFEAALRLRPKYAEAENNLGDCLNRLGRAAEAVPHLERALALQPKYAGAHNNLGVSLMALERPADGMAQFREAVRLQPGDAQAHYNLGLALATAGRHVEAIPEFAEASRLRPNYASAELNWAQALTLENQFDAAFPHYERALAARPDLPDIHDLYGRALARAGRADAAIAQFRAALDLDPNRATTHLDLAIALRQTGHNAEAQEHLDVAMRLGGPPRGNRNPDGR